MLASQAVCGAGLMGLIISLDVKRKEEFQKSLKDEEA